MDKEELYSLYCEYYNNLVVNEKLVFFESHNSMDLAGNMFYLIKEIEENPLFSDYQIVVSITVNSESKIRKFIENYSFDKTELVYRESDEYFRVLSTAKYLFTDVAFYPLFRKKNEQKCITTWHGTPLKTLGYTFWEDSYVVPNQKRGFLLSDYFICPNQYTWDCIKNSYQLDGLFKGKVIFNGYPRNEVFFDENRQKTMKEMLGVNGEKKIFVYMPTWRGKVVDVKGKEQSSILQKYLDNIDRLLPDNVEVWAKLHRLNEVDLDFSEFEHIKKFPSQYETYDVLNVADGLITDYSSVMFDYLVTSKKIILFCYDKFEYTTKRECYFNIDDLPFPIVETVEQLIEEIVGEKKYDDEEVKKKFCQYENGKCSEIILKYVLKDIEQGSSLTLQNNSKEKRICFIGDLRKGEETDYLFDFLEDKEVYISYMNHLFLNNTYKLLQVKNFNKIPLYMFQNGYSKYTTEEKKTIARIRAKIKAHQEVSPDMWKKQDEIYSREIVRYLYQNKFSEFIRFAGLDLESLKFFSIFKGKKVIYIHDSMIEKAKDNIEFLCYLNRAMQKADEIHYANKDIYNKSSFLNKNLKLRT